MQNNVTELTQRLLRSLDSNYNVINMPEVLDIISCLERVAVTKELLETTRLGKHFNDLRRKTTNEQLAKRAKGLLKTWRSQVLPENNGQIKMSPPLEQSPLKGSPSPVTKVSPPHKLVSPGLAPQRLVSPSLSHRLASPKGVPQRLVSPNIQRLASSGVPQKLVSPKMPPLVSPKAIPQRLVSPKAIPQRLVSPKVTPQRLVSPKVTPQRLVSPKVPIQRLVSPGLGAQSTSQNLGVISPPLAANADVNLNQLKGIKRSAKELLENVNAKRARLNGTTDLDLSDNSNSSMKDLFSSSAAQPTPAAGPLSALSDIIVVNSDSNSSFPERATKPLSANVSPEEPKKRGRKKGSKNHKSLLDEAESSFTNKLAVSASRGSSKQNGLNAPETLRVAVIGQSAFAVDVADRLISHGHKVVGVFTIPDKGKKQDPLAKFATENDIPLFKFKAWRSKGVALPTVLEQYKSVNADLNILPYCSQFIPMEVINYPRLKSICYHPSILPRHRGASSINWTLICGDKKAGLSIFWADDGLDTGPVLLQEVCDVEEDDTVDSLYKRFLYPVGVSACARAVDMVASGTAPKVPQSEKGATYDPMLNKPELQKIDFTKKALDIHNFIRGNDSVPGASANIKLPGTAEYQLALFFGSTLWKSSSIPIGNQVDIEETTPGIIHEEGLLIRGSDGTYVNVKKVKVGGKMKNAATLDQVSKVVNVDFTHEEKNQIEEVRLIWENILSSDIEDDTDFFAAGGGSMDVVRLVEEVKDVFKTELENDDVFMAPSFLEFVQHVVLKTRGAGGNIEIDYRPVEIEANKQKLKFPAQLFINGEFIDAEGGKTLPTINPATEEKICDVQCASVNDVDRAVKAAEKAFTEGEWSKISARERGVLMFKLADLMQKHKEELATLESIDSGAVYTLALKTHVGMSIETWRYFAGWADKIQGSTIPVNHARPNRNLTFTRKEPIGVCGLVTPWNYPLMMLSWKMAACLAAGNTVVIKPAQVSPLTALKFAELSAKAGFPPGVINVVHGKGSEAGNALAHHPLVRKLGFTGSTEVGQTIMRSCADSNLKKVSLELGGKSPLVIFSDCDLDKAVRLGMQSVFFNKGENCIAAGRLFVEDGIYKEFIRRVVGETKKITIGDPLNKSTAHGPQNHLAHLNKLLEYVERGIKEGARLEYGGKRLNRSGYFFEPTIFSEVEDSMWIAKEESFGPIMIISRFKNGDIDGVLKRANASEYGLASGVFTKDISKALRFAEKIEAGTVFINTYNKTDVAAPFGGFKQSGFGKDLGQEALNEYLKTKCVTVEY